MNDTTYQHYTKDPLWIKIAGYSIDDRTAAFPFSSKLAKEQNYSEELARRAIDEYKRFIYLCCTAPQGASPPPIVDEVWHLHLTYTAEYWQRFCRDTLGKEVHHHPARGGPEETDKHMRWYAETVALYRSTFGHGPPPDIWPPPITDTFDNIPGDYFFETGPRRRFLLLLIPFIYILIAFCQLIPFLLTGRQFLDFYFLLIVSTLICTAISIKAKQSLLCNLPELLTGTPDKYRLAWLAGGQDRFMVMCLSDLIANEYIVYAGNHFYTLNLREGEESDNPLFPYLKDLGDDTQFTLKYLVSYIPTVLSPVTNGYQRLLSAYIWSWCNALPWLVVLVLGVARCIQGYVNGRPVTYLIMMLILVGWVISKVISREQDFHKVLQKAIAGEPANMGNLEDGLAKSIIVAGPDVLWGRSEYYDLTQVYYSLIVAKTIGGDGGSGSSCGSSCGGGGCGGCGGCGG